MMQQSAVRAGILLPVRAGICHSLPVWCKMRHSFPGSSSYSGMSSSSKFAIIDQVGMKAGMDYYDTALMEGIAKLGIDASIYSNYSIQGDGIHYIPLFEQFSEASKPVKLFRLLRAIVSACLDCRRKGIRIAIAHVFSANLTALIRIGIARLFGIRSIIIAHDISSFVGEDNARIQNLIYNRLSKYIVVHNKFCYDLLLENHDISQPEKVRIIKHGGYPDQVDWSISREQARDTLGLGRDGKYILFFGQIKKVKGIDTLLEAMPAVDEDVQLIIAGKPWKDDFSSYDEIIERLAIGDRISKYIRFIEDDEREMFMHAADAIILPYREIYQSGVLLMAMSYKLPAVTSDLPANREVIDDGVNGLLFRTGDSEDLAGRINSLFVSDDAREAMREKAYETINTAYSWDRIAQDYKPLIDAEYQ